MTNPLRRVCVFWGSPLWGRLRRPRFSDQLCVGAILEKRRPLRIYLIPALASMRTSEARRLPSRGIRRTLPAHVRACERPTRCSGAGGRPWRVPQGKPLRACEVAAPAPGPEIHAVPGRSAHHFSCELRQACGRTGFACSHHPVASGATPPPNQEGGEFSFFRR